MKTRHLEADQWLNRKEWCLGSGRRRQLSQDQKIDRQTSATSFILGHIFSSPEFSAKFTEPCSFLTVKDTFHIHTKGEEHYCIASWCEGCNLNLVPTERDCIGEVYPQVRATVISTSTVAVVLLTFSFRFLGRSLITASYKTIVNTGGFSYCIENLNPLNAELNPICYLLALLGAQHFLHVSRIRVKLLTFRLLMSYIYIWSTHS